MLELQINGKPQQVAPGSNVANLIGTLHLEGKRYAIELNGEIVPKSRHAVTGLNHGDKLEVVIAVGGG
ncbi:MAG: sulfur carrier protein ThiS [Betaproteobacteria bacterium]